MHPCEINTAAKISGHLYLTGEESMCRIQGPLCSVGPNPGGDDGEGGDRPTLQKEHFRTSIFHVTGERTLLGRLWREPLLTVWIFTQVPHLSKWKDCSLGSWQLLCLAHMVNTWACWGHLVIHWYLLGSGMGAFLGSRFKFLVPGWSPNTVRLSCRG
jgi:hypothetical protein